MSLLYTLIAAAQLSTLISAAPLRSSLLSKRAVSYIQYTGNGETPAWPAQSSWQSLDDMFSDNMNIMTSSCTQWNVPNNSDQEIADLKSAISSVASSSGIPAQFIFAIVMQESNGCVRAPTTNYGVRNPGLMQDHDGTGTCNDGGNVQNPCPASQITQMIKDGVTGTAAGDGLQQCITESGATDVSKYYKAARIYNSGSITGDNLSLGVATHCYASDVANRLTGWSSAPHDCNLDGADVPVNTAPAPQSPASTSAAPAAPTSASSTAQAPAPTSTTPVSVPVPTTVPTTVPSTTIPAPFSGIPTTFTSLPTALPSVMPGGVNSSPADGGAKAVGSPSAAASSTSAAPSTTSAAAAATSAPAAAPASSSGAELGPGVSSSCPQLVTVAEGDNCWTLGQKYSFTFAQFQQWNTKIDAQCSNLWKGYQYCVQG